MPLYTYQCSNCKVLVVDKLEPISAEQIQDCPQCKKKHTFIRQLSAPSSINFSGSGWYKDGYATHDFTVNTNKTTA